ncbi:MAG: hypothetical protein WED00_13830 [Aquisalimonadaceae bacterium]
MSTSKRKGPPWPLILLLAAFLVPATIAWTLFFSGWQPTDTANHGELLVPPQRIEGRLLTDTGIPVDADILRGKWTILIVSHGACEADCLERLVQTRQARLALAQHTDRTRRVLLMPEGVPGLNGRDLDAHPDLTVYRGDSAMLPSMRLPADAPVHVSLIDTGAYRMMVYPEPLDSGGLLQDMKRLLRLSNVDLERLQGVTEEDGNHD